ncbi:MAG: hypothetical protein P8N58_03845 [Emcibacteraceae bacterium]|nr:hypothetical protein [Emcibacteraceae bacterium]
MFIRFSNVSIALLLSILVTACAGTGTKNYADLAIELAEPGSEKVYVYRSKQKIAALNLFEMKLNDMVVGDIGQGEVLSALMVDGSNRLDILVKSPIPGLGLKSDPIVFDRQTGSSMYFLVDIKEGFFTNELRVFGVTKAGFEANLGD